MKNLFKLTGLAIFILLHAAFHSDTSAADYSELTFNLISLDPGRETIRLPVTKGTYIAGEVKSAGRFSLCLLDENNVCLRQLVPAQSGHAWFYFIADADTPVLRSDSAHPVDITLQKIVSPEQQTQATPDFMSPTIKQAYSMLMSDDSDVMAWQLLSAKGAPTIESTSNPEEYLLTFIYKGAQYNALIFGAPDREHGWMTRLGESDIWFKTYRVPGSTLLSYQIAPDVPKFSGSPFEQRVALKATAQRDPLNPEYTKWSAADPHLQFSVVALPDAPAFNRCVENCSLKGQIQLFTLTSEILENQRQISVYSSPGNTHPSPRLQLLLFDGVQFTTEVNVLTSLERAVLNSDIPALEVVLIDSLDNATRGKELPDNPAFTRMLTNELLPAIAQITSRNYTAGTRVLAGASYGGLGAFTHSFRAPAYFGNAIVMSGSFWWADQKDYPQDKYFISERVMASPTQPVRYRVSAGLFESSPTGKKGILSGSRHLRDILRIKGYNVRYREYAAGHDYVIWERALVNGLMTLFPAGVSVERSDITTE